MTLKEQIMKLQTYKMHEGEDTVYVERDDVLKALEQEPYEDCISRQTAIEVAKQYWYKPDIAGALAELPSVQPEPKTAHWIEGRTNNPKIHNILCSNCFEGTQSKGHARSQYTREKFKYCRNCGAKMIEPQESEKINCKTTKCENCTNHNYCDFEPQESE